MILNALYKLLPARSWLFAGAALLAVLLVVGWCSSRKAAETAKDQATIADGRTATAVEVLDVVANNAAADAATQQQVKDAQDAVRQADPADRERVARRELCKLQGRSPC